MPRKAKVFYVDRLPTEELQHHYAEVAAAVARPDVVADAMHLPFAACSLDFLIASHVLEHLPLPLAALRHWYDLLRPGGVLLLKIPDKRFTFDVRRERTALKHLIAEDGGTSNFDKQAHFEDWVENVVGRKRGTIEFRQEVDRLLASDYSIHYHTWIDEDVREIVQYTRTAAGLRWEPLVFWDAHIYRKECILLLQRSGTQQPR